jgi:hypothetical protein
LASNAYHPVPVEAGRRVNEIARAKRHFAVPSNISYGAIARIAGRKPMELHTLLDNVSDERSFLQFAKALEIEAPSDYGSNAFGWENSSIAGFLESAIAWAEASDFGANSGGDETNLWKKFATFLYCGKIYE